MKAKLIKGKDLSKNQRSQILSRYIYRHLAIGEGKYYKTEQDWLFDHAFYFKQNGQLDERYNHCEPHYITEAESPEVVNS